MKNLLYILLFCTTVSIAQIPALNNIVKNNTLTSSRVAASLEVMEPYTLSGTDTYTVNIQVVGLYSGSDTYANGDQFTLIVANTNTGPSTVNINSEGAKAIKKADGSDVDAGDLISGGIYRVAYDGTYFILESSSGAANANEGLTESGGFVQLGNTTGVASFNTNRRIINETGGFLNISTYTTSDRTIGATFQVDAFNGVTLSGSNFANSGQLSLAIAGNTEVTSVISGETSRLTFGSTSATLSSADDIFITGTSSNITVEAQGAGSDVVLNAADDINLNPTGDFLLKSDAGAVGEFFAADGTWGVPAGTVTTPAGANTEVQYNNSGVFGAESAFVYNPSNNAMTIGTAPTRVVMATSGGANIELTQTNQATVVSTTGISSIKTGAPSGFDGLGILAASGVSGSVNGGSILIASGGTAQATGVTGSITLTLGSPSGGATQGNINLNAIGGGEINLSATSSVGSYIIMTGLPTSCAGAPTGAIANIVGVLNICP